MTTNREQVYCRHPDYSIPQETQSNERPNQRTSSCYVSNSLVLISVRSQFVEIDMQLAQLLGAMSLDSQRKLAFVSPNLVRLLQETAILT